MNEQADMFEALEDAVGVGASPMPTIHLGWHIWFRIMILHPISRTPIMKERQDGQGSEKIEP